MIRLRRVEEYNVGWVERTKEMGVTTIQFEAFLMPLVSIMMVKSLLRNVSSITKLLTLTLCMQRLQLWAKKESVDYQVEFYYTAEDKLNSSILYGPLE